MKEILYDWWGLNGWLFLLINGGSSKTYRDLMLFFTDLGDYHHFKYYVIVVALGLGARLLYLRYRRKQPVDALEVRKSVATLITLMMGFALNGIMVGVLKTVIKIPRPFMIYRKPGEMIFDGPYPAPAEYLTSFPSPHAATIAFVVACVWSKLNLIGRILCSLLVFLVCWSRIAVGMHFPADLVAGVIIGCLAAWGTRRYVNRMMRLT